MDEVDRCILRLRVGAEDFVQSTTKCNTAGVKVDAEARFPPVRSCYEAVRRWLTGLYCLSPDLFKHVLEVTLHACACDNASRDLITELSDRLQSRTSGLVHCRQGDGDTDANERTNDGADGISTMGTPTRAERATCTHVPNTSPTSRHSTQTTSILDKYVLQWMGEQLASLLE